MKDRSDPAAAAQEAFEEAGVGGEIDVSPIGVFHYLKRLKSGQERRLKVAVYPLLVTQEHESWPEWRERERRWMTPANAAAAVREPDLSLLIERFAAERTGDAL